MDKIAPSNQFCDDSGGSMMFTVPIKSTNEIAPLFKLLEEDEDNEQMKYDEVTDSYQTDEDPYIRMLKSIVTDCGISHSTLEEVFMKVTGKKQNKNRTTKDKRNGPKESNVLSEENLNQISSK